MRYNTPMTKLTEDLMNSLRQRIQPEKKDGYQRFFKTGPGQYGEGDVFWGITVPHQREVVKAYASQVGLTEIHELLSSEVHECRLTALLIMVAQFTKGSPRERQSLIEVYLERVDRINNWDLVDASAPGLLGVWLLDKDTSLLLQWAQSGHLWKQRIAMIATWTFIRKERWSEPLQVAQLLVHHPHDLIHKAVGWMLRELGKRNLQAERQFLEQYAPTMPRTMLRYALEKWPADERSLFMLRPAGARG